MAEQFAVAIQTAETIMTQTFGSPVRLQAGDQLHMGARNNLLLRCHVLQGPSGVPNTVIIKQAGFDHYRPDPVDLSVSAWSLGNEWAAGQFLGTIRPANLGPHLYGGNRDKGLLVLEDLGTCPTVLEALQGTNRTEADRLLMAYARQMGTLHAATAGHYSQWEQIRRTFGTIHHPNYGGKALRIRQELPHIHEVLARIGINLREQFDQEAWSVAQALEQGPFLTLLQGDPCLDNCLQVKGGVRFVDFEFTRFGLALFDWVYPRLAFPSCWSENRLPQDLLYQMEAVYRTELSHGCPSAENDRVFNQALVQACAAWILTTFYRYLEKELKDEDQDKTELRLRTLARLNTFVTVIQAGGCLAELRSVAAEVLDRLSRQWSLTATDFPLYPVFTQSSAEEPK